MADIFISYAREDRDWVQALARGLEAAGFSVWWDRRIQGGANFHQAIEAELARARCVIVVWSKQSAGSTFVINEASEGLRLDKLIPVSKDRVAQPLAFRHLQLMDMSGWSNANTNPFRDLVRDVAQMVGRKPMRVAEYPEPPKSGGSVDPDLKTKKIVLMVAIAIGWIIHFAGSLHNGFFYGNNTADEYNLFLLLFGFALPIVVGSTMRDWKLALVSGVLATYPPDIVHMAVEHNFQASAGADGMIGWIIGLMVIAIPGAAIGYFREKDRRRRAPLRRA